MHPRLVAERELVEMLGDRLRAYFPVQPVDHPGIWISQLFDRVRAAIPAEDKVAISIACDLIAHDPHLPFGKLIKSGLSRELRRYPEYLLEGQRLQLVQTTVKLLALKYAPRELEDYARLVAKLPRAEYFASVEQSQTRNEKAAHLKEYLLVGSLKTNQLVNTDILRRPLTPRAPGAVADYTHLR